MKAGRMEMSPIPGVCSVKSERLILTKAERNALARAAEIANKMREAVRRLEGIEPGENADCDYEMDTQTGVVAGYIEEWLNEHHPIDGLRVY